MKIREKMRLAGDLMTDAELFPFTIEVKRRENWSERNLIKGFASPIWSWWKQVCKDASEEGGIPMLWFRKNRRRWRILLPAEGAIPQEAWEQMRPHFGIPPANDPGAILVRFGKLTTGRNLLPVQPVQVTWEALKHTDPKLFAKADR